MNTIQIKHKLTGDIIFEHTCEDNTMKKTVLAAIACGTNLSNSDLSYSNLSYSNLSNSDLSYSNLSGSDLSYSNLSGSDLSYSNLSGSDLSYSDLSCCYLPHTSICPDGTIIGWKKLQNGVIAKIKIPEDALRINAIGQRKCRASKAIVISLEYIDGKTFSGSAVDSHTGKLVYGAGIMVIPDSFDPDVREPCSNGIHFFITRKEAEEY